ncbi:MAG: hypothetical protein IH597_09385 [Bacteroidales bacterium]|nr:hypothetical protein [Bacteroidales bacterium]
MKNLQHLIVLVIMILFSLGCNKNEEPRVMMQQYVVFSVSQIDPLLLKDASDIECPLDADGNLKIPTVAEVVINDTTYYPSTYYLNDKLYTQAIKLALPEGSATSYNISWFALLESIGGDIIMATPLSGSYYADYVTSVVDFDINVSPFEKTEVQVDVLCYLTEACQLFGFSKQAKGQYSTARSNPYITPKP